MTGREERAAKLISDPSVDAGRRDEDRRLSLLRRTATRTIYATRGIQPYGSSIRSEEPVTTGIDPVSDP